ncbi:ABC transporter permease [Brevibacterium sp. 91QC2O2]|uniref:ABC transporter permease n=1 Tax=Brevibacterium sp. 91QC2O2 TaxID=2968458 RepID=UPI00211C0912|nr:ABC transporter permease [Brevibacterium sp. 91QC2O2]MCQ9368060.1 ABC transporter permease [Brevibacterium sp. 91QC2O2]
MTTSAELAAQYGLSRVGARPNLFAYLREVWKRRDFTLSLAKYRIKSENERNRLGMAWVLLRPILSAIMYGCIFGLILGGSRPPNFVPYVVVGVFMLEFFNSSMTGGSKSIIKNTSLVQTLPFPRMVLVIAQVAQNLLNFIPTLLLMVIVAMIFGARPSWSWFAMIGLIVLFTMFNMGVALIFARLTVHFHDLSQVTPFISRMIFYTSGVFFDPQRIVAGHPVLEAIYPWHPLNEVLSIARGILLPADHPYDPSMWWMLAIWSVVMLVVGTVYFWKAEERYGRE